MFAGQLITGGVTSLTVKPTMHVSLLLKASVTITVIGCEPAPLTVLPCIGLCVTVSRPLAVQLSDDCALTRARTSGTVAKQLGQR